MNTINCAGEFAAGNDLALRKRHALCSDLQSSVPITRSVTTISQPAEHINSENSLP